MDASTPREVFQAVFDLVLDEIDQNPDFAEKLAERLPDGLSLVAHGRKKAPAAAPPALMAADLKALRAEIGQIELRERLAVHKNAELIALIRAKALADGPLSKKNKGQLINIIVRASK